MATYKVIQDIEAEDKLLGPLTLKQFIYAGVTAICLYASFLALTKHVTFLLAIFLPPGLLTGFLAFPWKRDQPTEVWAVAKIRFLFKPRKRIWNQSGVKDLVTITAPKHVEHNYTNGLTQSEVKSRLHALADTIDSRGWAVKNVNVNLYSEPVPILEDPDSDRLIDVANLPQDVPTTDIGPSDDIFESPVADHFGAMITATNQAHRQAIVNQLHQQAVASTSGQAPPNDYWFMNQSDSQAKLPNDYVTFNTQVVAPGATDDDLPVMPAIPTPAEEAFAERHKLEESKPPIENLHLRTIQPLSAQTSAPTIGRPAAPTPTTTVTQPPDPAILGLASDNDKNVATIARMAGETNHPRESESSDEVVISLH